MSSNQAMPGAVGPVALAAASAFPSPQEGGGSGAEQEVAALTFRQCGAECTVAGEHTQREGCFYLGVGLSDPSGGER